MFDMIREWPRYVKLPFPIAKVINRSNHSPFMLETPMIFMCSFVRQSVSETNLNYGTLRCYDLRFLFSP